MPGHLEGAKHVARVWQGPQAVQELPAVVVGRRPDAVVFLVPPDIAVCSTARA